MNLHVWEGPRLRASLPPQLRMGDLGRSRGPGPHGALLSWCPDSYSPFSNTALSLLFVCLVCIFACEPAPPPFFKLTPCLCLLCVLVFLSHQMVVVPVAEPWRHYGRDDPPLSVSPVTWSTPEQGPMTNHAPEQSGNGEAALGVSSVGAVHSLSLLELGPLLCLPLT